MQNVKVTRKGKGAVSARISIIFARESSSAVIFRRGPSGWVQIVKWDTTTDTFETGQWFHGKIYDRRSDLSPDGSMLVYFAQKINDRTLQDTEYTYAWTAVSRPPYLTALALWPKGDCWHGGGQFQNDKTLILNHKSNVAKPHPRHLPQGIRVILKNHVHGEDDPIFSERLERDGWDLKQDWIVENHGYPKMFETRQAEVREKLNQDRSQFIRLTRSIESLDYSEEFSLFNGTDSTAVKIDRASWADWDHQGRFVFAREGKIFKGRIDDEGLLNSQELIDLNPSAPTTVPTPDWASKW